MADVGRFFVAVGLPQRPHQFLLLLDIVGILRGQRLVNRNRLVRFSLAHKVGGFFVRIGRNGFFLLGSDGQAERSTEDKTRI